MKSGHFQQLGYVKVAEATSLSQLAQMVADRELKKGSRVKLKLELSAPIAWAFDVAGAESLFAVPQGMKMVDVWGEGSSTGYVEMEADPVWLVALLGFIAANWAAILITTLVLGTILVLATLFVKITGAVAGIPGLILLLLVALGLYAYSKEKRYGEKRHGRRT